jgi:predicted nuclease of predicted toxin-antitoxin system
LLLDEHFSPEVAEQLRAQGLDALAVAAVPALRHMGDEELLRWASTERRVLVTENVRDFAPLHGAFLNSGEDHCGLVFTSAVRFPRRRSGIGALVRALAALASEAPDLRSDTYWLDAVEER